MAVLLPLVPVMTSGIPVLLIMLWTVFSMFESIILVSMLILLRTMSPWAPVKFIGGVVLSLLCSILKAVLSLVLQALRFRWKLVLTLLFRVVQMFENGSSSLIPTLLVRVRVVELVVTRVVMVVPMTPDTALL